MPPSANVTLLPKCDRFTMGHQNNNLAGVNVKKCNLGNCASIVDARPKKTKQALGTVRNTPCLKTGSKIDACMQ